MSLIIYSPQSPKYLFAYPRWYLAMEIVWYLLLRTHCAHSTEKRHFKYFQK